MEEECQSIGLAEAEQEQAGKDRVVQQLDGRQLEAQENGQRLICSSPRSSHAILHLSKTSAGSEDNKDYNNSCRETTIDAVCCTAHLLADVMIVDDDGGEEGCNNSNHANSVNNANGNSNAAAADRQARVAAAQAARRSAEQEKARVKRAIEEDAADRRQRQALLRNPTSTSSNNNTALDDPCTSNSHAIATGQAQCNDHAEHHSTTEIQLRCEDGRVLRHTFNADDTLRTVRTYLEQEMANARFPSESALPPASTPASRRGRRLSDNARPEEVSVNGTRGRGATLGDDERELLRQARQQFVEQTKRIMQEAAALRGADDDNSDDQQLCFLVPFSSREYRTEEALGTTLREAELVPRGTLIVQKASTRGRITQAPATVCQPPLSGQASPVRVPALDVGGGGASPAMARSLSGGNLASPVRRSPSANQRSSPFAATSVNNQWSPPVEPPSPTTPPVRHNEAFAAVAAAAAARRMSPSVEDHHACSLAMPPPPPSPLLLSGDVSPTTGEREERARQLREAAENRMGGGGSLGVSSRATTPPPPYAGASLAATVAAAAADQSSADIRIRCENGDTVTHSFDPQTLMRMVRDSCVPAGEELEDYGLLVPFPRREFFDEASLSLSVREAGLCPRGTVHLLRVAQRGTVMRAAPATMAGFPLPTAHVSVGVGTRSSLPRGMLPNSNHTVTGATPVQPMQPTSVPAWRGGTVPLPGPPVSWGDHLMAATAWAQQLNHSRAPVWEMNPAAGAMSYEQMLALQERIGRVQRGLPAEALSALPSAALSHSSKAVEDCVTCPVCIAEYAPGDEVLTLPCMHFYHTNCITRWLSSNSSCPVCKRSALPEPEPEH
eukprot:jgi/Chlat1/8499/Chrsp80S07893